MGLAPPQTKTFSKATPLEAADPSLLYGVELEIENTAEQEWLVTGMRGEPDGSLRNHGFEYITQPMTYSNAAHCLSTFFTRSKVTDANYSERCSVHVHTNCLDLTIEQLTSLLLLYQTFERVLFNFIGHDRDKNIFCVPWSQTTLHYGVAARLVKGDTSAVHQWQKYTAVNLLPLLEQGTIEWRHMHGNCDLQYILKWMNIIGNMYRVARAQPLTDIKKEIVELNTNSQYRVFMSNVFQNYFPELMTTSSEEDIEDGVLQTKYSLLETVTVPKKKPMWDIPHPNIVEAEAQHVERSLRNPFIEGLQTAAIDPDWVDREVRRLRDRPAAQLRPAIDPAWPEPEGVLNEAQDVYDRWEPVEDTEEGPL